MDREVRPNASSVLTPSSDSNSFRGIGGALSILRLAPQDHQLSITFDYLAYRYWRKDTVRVVGVVNKADFVDNRLPGIIGFSDEKASNVAGSGFFDSVGDSLSISGADAHFQYYLTVHAPKLGTVFPSTSSDPARFKALTSRWDPHKKVWNWEQRGQFTVNDSIVLTKFDLKSHLASGYVTLNQQRSVHFDDVKFNLRKP
jgi:hypothetical protein